MGFDLTFCFFFPHISSVDFYTVVSIVLRVAKRQSNTNHNRSREKEKDSGMTVGIFRLEGIFSSHLQNEQYS